MLYFGLFLIEVLNIFYSIMVFRHSLGGSAMTLDRVNEIYVFSRVADATVGAIIGAGADAAPISQVQSMQKRNASEEPYTWVGSNTIDNYIKCRDICEDLDNGECEDTVLESSFLASAKYVDTYLSCQPGMISAVVGKQEQSSQQVRANQRLMIA